MRLLLISHAAGDGDLTAGARTRVTELGHALPRPRAAFTSPARSARQTAEALGLVAVPTDALADWGEESYDALLVRVARWLAVQEAAAGTRAAVTHGAVIRAALVIALDAPPKAFSAIAIAPCSISELAHRDDRWQVARANWEPALLHIPQRRRARRRIPSP